MIDSIKDLERLLKLCRKQGVLEITTAEVSFKLGEVPVKHPDESIEDQEEGYPSFDEPLTNEELTRYANGEDILTN